MDFSGLGYQMLSFLLQGQRLFLEASNILNQFHQLLFQLPMLFYTPHGHTPALVPRIAGHGARELRLFTLWEAQFVTGGIIYSVPASPTQHRY
jgi:hypothetical protein